MTPSRAAGRHLPVPIRAGIYCRISKDDEGDMLGVRRQEKDARGLCERKGWVVTEVFVDDDVSAWSGRLRPAYHRMLEAIEDGTITAVVAYDLDRLHRLPRELEQFFLVCDRADVTNLATVAGDVDLASSDGQFHARIMGAVAKKASDDASRRIRRKFAERAEQGLPHGTRAFGYKSDGRTIAVREARLIREAADAILKGESLANIARAWNKAGVTTPQRSRPWSGPVVKAVLINPRQAGLRVHHGEVVGPGQWPAILDRATHERLRAVLLSPSRRAVNPPRRQPFTGLIRCGKCGAPLYRGVGRARPGRKGLPTYQCRLAPGRPGCGGMSVSAQPLETLILEAMILALDTPRLATARQAPTKGEVDLGSEIARIEARLNELAQAYADESLSMPEWLTARTRLEARLQKAQAAAARVDSAAALSGYEGQPDRLRSDWDHLTVERRRAVLAAVFQEVVVLPAAGRGARFDRDRVEVTWRG